MARGSSVRGPDQGLAADKRVTWAFWVLGAGVLLSWNVLICSFPLFSSFFPAESSTRSNLASILSTVYCFSNLFFLGVAQRTVGTVLAVDRLRKALLVLVVISAIGTFPVIPLLLPSLSASAVLIVLLAITLGLGASTAYLQSAVVALAALWGSDEMLSVMSGQGGIAVMVSGVQLALAVASAFGGGRSSGGDDSAEVPSLMVGISLWGLCAIGAVGCLYATRFLRQHEQYERVMGAKSGTDPALALRGGGADGKTKRIFWKNIRVEFAVAWVFIVTLSVFPPITTAITSTRNPVPRLLQPGVFIPLHFLLFNIGDYIGRTYAPAIPALFITAQRRILLLSLARTLFIPVFLACNVVTAATSGADRSPLIESDVAYFAILLLFGITNGWTSSLCMITASSPALNPGVEESEKDVAGTMAGFCLVAGLAGGSVASFGVNWFVRGSLI